MLHFPSSLEHLFFFICQSQMKVLETNPRPINTLHSWMEIYNIYIPCRETFTVTASGLCWDIRGFFPGPSPGPEPASGPGTGNVSWPHQPPHPVSVPFSKTSALTLQSRKCPAKLLFALALYLDIYYVRPLHLDIYYVLFYCPGTWR
jgi:hypothetical protein